MFYGRCSALVTENVTQVCELPHIFNGMFFNGQQRCLGCQRFIIEHLSLRFLERYIQPKALTRSVQDVEDCFGFLNSSCKEDNVVGVQDPLDDFRPRQLLLPSLFSIGAHVWYGKRKSK